MGCNWATRQAIKLRTKILYGFYMFFIWFYMFFICFYMFFIWFYVVFIWFYIVFIWFLYDFWGCGRNFRMTHFFEIWTFDRKFERSTGNSKYHRNSRMTRFLNFERSTGNSNVRREIRSTTEIFGWPVFLKFERSWKTICSWVFTWFYFVFRCEPFLKTI